MLYKMSTETDKYTTKLKYNAFMGTIAICVLYAIIAFIMILYINLTEQGKALYADLKPFAVTFIFGTIIIIVAITIMVFNWQPEQAKKKNSDDFILTNKLDCPDYFKLEKVTGADKEVPDGEAGVLLQSSEIITKNKIDNEEKKLKLFHGSTETEYVDLYDYAITNTENIQNKCVYDADKVYTDENDFKTNSEIVDSLWAAGTTGGGISMDGTPGNKVLNGEKENAKKLAAMTVMNRGYTCNSGTCTINNPYSNNKADITSTNKAGNSITISDFKYDCTKVYPEYLTYLDAKEYAKNNERGPKNLHRCQWSEVCGVPWSAAGCDK